MLSVGLFTDTYGTDTNGVSVGVRTLAFALRRLGLEVWIVSPDDAAAADRFQHITVPSVRYPFFRTQRIAVSRRLSAMPRLDLVHIHTPLVVGSLGARLALHDKLPVVSTFHVDLASYAHYVPIFGPRLVSVARKLYLNSDLVIAPSKFAANTALSLGVKGPIINLPNGVDFDSLRSSPRVNTLWRPGARRLLSVGRLGREKNHFAQLKLMDILRRHVNAHLVIVGDGPERRRLQHMINALDLSDSVTLVGHIDHEAIGSIYREAEVYVITSESETQGLATWEAQAMGLPVVGFGVAGTTEAVLSGVTGLLSISRNPMDLVDKIVTLLRDDGLRLRFGERAVSHAQTCSALTVAGRHVQEYERLFAQNQKDKKPLSSLGT